jgi:hypothetical protein
MSTAKQYAPKTAPQTAPNPTLEAALSYAAQGLAVFRLAYRTKFPLKGSHGFYDATTDPTIITELFSTGPYNVAIATGQVSGIGVLDIDPRKHGFESFEAMVDEYGEPFETDGPKIITGSSGWQFPFQMPTALIRSGSDVFGLPGIDVKADGGYVVAPPSVHPNGPTYLFEDGRSYNDLPVPQLSERWLNLLLKVPPDHLGGITLEEYSHSVTVGAGVAGRFSTPLDPTFDPRQVDIRAIQRELAELVKTRGLGDKETFAALVRRPDLQYLGAIGRGVPVQAVVQAIRIGDSGKIYCIKPGHDDKHTSKSAGLRVHSRHKTLQYQDYHGDQNAREVNHRIPDLEANMHKKGREISLTNAALKAWQVRLWVMDGLLQPAVVPHVPLPERLPEKYPDKLKPITIAELQRVYDVALDVLSIKWLYGEVPQAMTHKFLETWGGLTEHLVKKAMPWLLYLRMLQGGVFLQKHGGFSDKRIGERDAECFVPGDGRYEKRQDPDMSTDEETEEFFKTYRDDGDNMYFFKTEAEALAWDKEREGMWAKSPECPHIYKACRCGCLEPVKTNQVWASPGCRKRVQRAIAAMNIREYQYVRGSTEGGVL